MIEYPPLPPDEAKYRAYTCKCGMVISGTSPFKDHWVEIMCHVVGDCPLVDKKRGRKIMPMINRDNLGENDSRTRDEGGGGSHA